MSDKDDTSEQSKRDVPIPDLIDEFCLSDILNLTSTFIQAFMYHGDAENVLNVYKQSPRTDILYRKEELQKRTSGFVRLNF